MRNVVFVLAAMILLIGVVFADQTATATIVGVQTQPSDLNPVVVAGAGTVQATQYSHNQVASSSNGDLQSSRYDKEQVVTTAKVFDQNVTIPKVSYTATYDVEHNTTTVSVSVQSDPVPTYFVFIYTPDGKFLKSYSSNNPSSSATLSGEYDELYIVVIANAIGTGGLLDLGKYPLNVLGTNIIPVLVDSVGKYNVKVYGGYAITPVYVGDVNKPLYIIAASDVVKAYVSP